MTNGTASHVTFSLKPLSREGVEAALRKAERYRLLNEPSEAESICLDVLEADPGNQEAVIMALLASTDQFGTGTSDVTRARSLLARLNGEYERAYYAGIICERRGHADLRREAFGAGAMAHRWLREAMDWYERAEGLRAAGDDASILRWNACARTIMNNHHVRPVEHDGIPEMLE